jgi:hypothetical protein
MRFYVDENMDAEVCSVLAAKGHEAWTARTAAKLRASDTEQALYAHDQHAVYVTHDRELVTSRQDQPIGRYLRLRGPEMLAPELAADALSVVLPILEHNENVVIVVSRTSSGEINVKTTFGTEGRRRAKKPPPTGGDR